MNNEIKEILFSLLNVFVIGIIFIGLSDPVDGLILAIIIIALVLGIAYSPIGSSAAKWCLNKMKVKTSEGILTFPQRFWILSFATYVLTSKIIGGIFAVIWFIGKFFIALCICIATGKLLTGGLLDFWASKQYANVLVEVYIFCTSITDKIIELIMRGEAKVIGIKEDDFI